MAERTLETLTEGSVVEALHDLLRRGSGGGPYKIVVGSPRGELIATRIARRRYGEPPWIDVELDPDCDPNEWSIEPVDEEQARAGGLGE